jgi:hypothetical protein
MARRTGAARLLSAAGGVLVVVAISGLAPASSGVTPTAAAQTAGEKDRQQVPIQTVDGVELVGNYLRGNQGRDTPCVILVHRLGGDSTRSDWLGLARDLNQAGFAVLTFDLRGHGKSTTVDPAKFWSVAANRQLIRPERGASSAAALSKKTTIKFDEFQPRYLPMLVNDVLAARRFLEVKNDAGELNTSSIVVIGAQEGAALGLLFTASEFARQYRVGVVPLQSEGTRHIAGEDIAAGVWLSLPLTTSQGIRFNTENWIKAYPVIRDKVPMCFVYGERDRKSKDDADAVLRGLSVSGREKHKLDTKIELKGTDLAGQALLGQSVLNVNAQIVAHVKKVMTERKAIPWTRVQTEVNVIHLVNLRPFGFQLP